MNVIRMLRNLAIAAISLLGFASIPVLITSAANAQGTLSVPAIETCSGPYTCGGLTDNPCCKGTTGPTCTCTNGVQTCKCPPPPPPQ